MAGGPGGLEVGRVSIRVVPDTSRFRKQLQRELKALTDDVKVKIGVEVDDKDLKQQVKKASDKAGKQSIKITPEVDSDGTVRQARRLRQIVQKAVGAIKMTVDLNLPASIALIKTQLAIIQKSVKGYNIRIPIEVVGLTKWLGILTAVSGVLLGIPHLLAAIGGAVNIVGGAMALLPAIAAGAAAGIAALVVGTQGFFAALGASGDAVAFEQALAKLTPSAQESARALAEFKEPLSEIRKSVQESLFSGMADQFSKLQSLLPPIKTGLTGVAGGIREMISSWIDMATSQRSVKDTGVILGNVTKAFEKMKPAMANFGQAFKDIAVVGSTFLPQLGQSVTNISQKFADWAAKARASGEMQEWIAIAIAKIKQLFRVIGNVINGFQNMTKAMREGAGEDFLDIMERLSKNFENFTGTEAFQSSLRAVARVMREVVDVGTTVFKALFTSLGDIFKSLEPFLIAFAHTLGAVIVGALKLITPLLQSMAKWLSENKEIMSAVAVTVVAFVTGFKLMATAARGVIAVHDSLNAMKAAGKIIGEVGSKIAEFATKVSKAMFKAAADAARAAARFIWAWTQIAAEAVRNAARAAAAWIAQTAKMVATATANAVKMAAIWIAQMIRMVAVTVTQLAVAAAAWVAHWVRMAAVALAQAVRMAAAWVIAMGPIGWVIAAIVALVALIVANWDAIWQTTVSVWNAVWKFVSDIFTSIRDFVVNIWNEIIGFFQKIPGWIGDAFSTVWDILSYPFRHAWQIITDLWNTIGDVFQGLIDTISGIFGPVFDIIAAPFELAYDTIKWIVDQIKKAFNTVKGMIEDIINLSPLSGMEDAFDFGSSTVPITFSLEKFRAPDVPEVDFRPYTFETFDETSGGVGSLVRTADLTARSIGKTNFEFSGADTDTNAIAAAVEEALSGWSVQIDANGMTKLVNKKNNSNKRRG